MQGGINNAALFGASQREARGKLEQMAGIKRPPSGILASSPELINAVGNAAAPAMPVRATGPATPMTPAPVPMVQAALPQVPAPTTVAPGPVQQPVQQAAPAPQPQQQPVMMNEGGFLSRAKETINAIPGKMAEAGMFMNLDKPAAASLAGRVGKDIVTIAKEKGVGPVDIGSNPLLNPVMALQGGAVFKFMMDMFGSEEKVAEEVQKKVDPIEAAIATENPENIAKTVADQAGLPATDEGVKEFASNVFGLDDVNDIDEINRRIADVAMSSAIGKGPDEFAAAILLGLQNYKQTASARAAAAADAAGGGFLDTERGKAALEVYIEKIKNNEDASQVEIDMNTQMGDNIGTRVRQAITGGTGGAGGGQQTPESLLAEARSVIEQGANPEKVKDRLREMGVDPGRL